MIKEFKIDRNNFSYLITIAVGRFLLGAFIAILIKIFIFRNNIDKLIKISPIIVTLIILLLVITIISTKKQLEGFNITLDEENIIETKNKKQKISLKFKEIKLIDKNKRGLIIKGKSKLPKDFIVVPIHMQQFNELEREIRKRARNSQKTNN